jgi:hypothetical protein
MTMILFANPQIFQNLVVSKILAHHIYRDGDRELTNDRRMNQSSALIGASLSRLDKKRRRTEKRASTLKMTVTEMTDFCEAVYMMGTVLPSKASNE